MSFRHARGARPDGDPYVEMTVPTRPGNTKLCECHGEPMSWAEAGASTPARWVCRVDFRTYTTMRNAKKARTTDGHTRRDTFDRYGGACYLCGIALRWDAWDEDHVIPLVLDGPDTIENCRPACRDCHRAKGSRVYVFPKESGLPVL